MKIPLLLLFALCAALAQEATKPTANVKPAAEVKPEDKCRLEGTVAGASTSEPLKKAHLVLHRMEVQDGVPYGATTDAAGHYVIEGVDPGKYQLQADRNGFVSQAYGGTARFQGTVLTLGPAQKMKDVNFKLTPQGVVLGRVVDEEGEPVAGVNVQCMRFAYRDGKRQLVPSGGQSTNDLGEYRAYGLAPGKYFVSAVLRQNNFGASPISTGEKEEGYPPIYYPNANAPSSAVPVEVTAGAVVHGIDITLVKTRAVRVSGNAIGSNGKPARNAQVTIRPKDASGFTMLNMSFVRDAKGSFEFRGVVPGVYNVRVNLWDEGNNESAKAQVEVGNSNIEGLQLSLTPGAEIKGTLKVEDNADIKGEQVSIALQSKEFDMFGGYVNGTVKDDGTFVVRGVSQESYTLSVWGMPAGFYLKSVRSGDTDYTEVPMDFSQGVTAGELSVLISAHGGVVEGAVQNDKQEPGVGVNVVLIPEANRREHKDLFKNVTTDQNGHYTIKGIAPGEYKLYAWDDIEPGAYMDPDFLKPFESAGEAITIREDSHESKTLTLIPAEGAKEKRH